VTASFVLGRKRIAAAGRRRLPRVTAFQVIGDKGMSKKIFVNLPVKQLDKSMAFFKALGFTFNPQFTDETAACMVISDDIFAMLLTEAKFKDFTRKPIADATKTTEVLTALSLDSKDEVNRMFDTALKAGATEARDVTDYGSMFGRSFNDLDGHIWEIFWMDPSYVHK
jgi:predicted lactoylglutathione lyase